MTRPEHFSQCGKSYVGCHPSCPAALYDADEERRTAEAAVEASLRFDLERRKVEALERIAKCLEAWTDGDRLDVRCSGSVEVFNGDRARRELDGD